MPKRRLALGMAVREGVGYEGESTAIISSLYKWRTRAGVAAGDGKLPPWPAMTAIWCVGFKNPDVPAPLGSGFPEAELIEGLHERGVLPVIFFQTTGYDRPDTSLQRWVDGDWDDHLLKFGRRSAEIGLPFVLRINQEPNGDWAPWSPSYYNQSPADYRKAWVRIFTKIHQGMGLGNNRIMKTWYTPMGSPPKELAAQDWNGRGIHRFYPGREYVDWLGFDKYAVRTHDNPSMISSYRSIYKRVKELGPQPIYVGETGILRNNTWNDVSRGVWLDDGLRDIKRTSGWARLKGIMYFNLDMTEQENRNWLLTGDRKESILGRWGQNALQWRYQRNVIW